MKQTKIKLLCLCLTALMLLSLTVYGKDKTTDAVASGGTGIVTEEKVQKGYVWMNEVNRNIFNTTYEEVVAYFGVGGVFVKEEYSDHMKANYRYYKWISEDDDSHFIYVNFKEESSGVYEVSGFQYQRLLRQGGHREVS